MKKVFSILVLAATVALVSCDNNGNTKAAGTDSMHHVYGGAEEAATTLPHTLASEKKDPVCGMPVTAGITDTAHYKGKVYGFCASECKKMFAENPESYTGKN
ncbi:MAG: YHS domain-containing protein [Chitinophagaceae bacterium]